MTNNAKSPAKERDNHKPSAGRRPFRAGSVKGASWLNVAPSLVAHLVRICELAGAAVTFSLTKDCTALTVALYHRGERHVEYLSSEAEVAEYADWLVSDFFEGSDKQAIDAFIDAS